MNKTVVGKLYMVGCGHCDALVKPWNEMKKRVEKKVMVAGDIERAENNKLDELNKQYRSNVEVQGGYPTIYKIKHGGKVEYYNGERTVQKLARWALHGANQSGTKYKHATKRDMKYKKFAGGKRNKTSKK
jgi:hypothetical protein